MNNLIAWERRGTARAVIIASERGAASVTLVDRATIPWRAVIGVGLTVGEATSSALRRWTCPDSYAVEGYGGTVVYEIPQAPDARGNARPPAGFVDREIARHALETAEQMPAGRAA